MLKYFWDPTFADDMRKKAWAALVDHVSRWREAVGATKHVDEDAVTKECNFLILAFPNLRMGELGYAIDLYIARALPTESYFNFTNFHPSYMSEVIRSYMRFKYDRLKSVIARVETAMSEPDPPTPAEQVALYRYMITEAKTQFDSKRQVIVFVGDIYKFLVRTGRIKVNLDSKELAHYVHKRLSQFANSIPVGDVKSIGDILNTAGTKQGAVFKRAEIFQMEYWVSSWIAKDLDVKLAKITVKDFI